MTTTITEINAMLTEPARNVAQHTPAYGTPASSPVDTLDGITAIPDGATAADALVHILEARAWMRERIDMSAGWPAADHAAVTLARCERMLRDELDPLDQIAYGMPAHSIVERWAAERHERSPQLGDPLERWDWQADVALADAIAVDAHRPAGERAPLRTLIARAYSTLV